MTRKRVAVVGLVGFTLLAAAIASGASGASKASPPGPPDKDLRDYLSATGPMYEWETKISKAVCNLEKYPTGLPAGGDRYCPGNGQWPPSTTPPPKFPPG
jgi:hypothetical protein